MTIKEDDKVANYSEEEAIKMIMDDLNKRLESKDEKQINDFIEKTIWNINNLLKTAREDKLKYLIGKFLNRFLVNVDPSVRVNACQNLDESLERSLEDLSFERQALLELKKYLASAKRTRDYRNIDTTFGVFYAIFILQSCRKDQSSTDVQVWNSGIKGITYYPACENTFNQEQLKGIIEEGIKRIKTK